MDKNKNEEWYEWDELDEFLSKKAKEYTVEKPTMKEIEYIIAKAEAEKKREMNLKIAAVIVVLFISVSTLYIYKNKFNNNKPENNILVAEKNEEINYITIDIKQNLESTPGSAILDREKDDLYEKSSDVVIVEVKSIEKIRIIKTIKGELKEEITVLKGDLRELVEERKVYMIYLIKNNSGEYLLQSEKNAIRQYNKENNTVLNNETGKWEVLDSILN